MERLTFEGNAVTNKEILQTIQALRCCATHIEKGCGLCPQMKDVRCTERLADESITMIERMTAENAALRKEIEWKDMVIVLAQRKQAEAEAERDALIEQIKERHDCLDCKHNDFCEFDGAIFFDCMNCVTKNCTCAGCFDSSRWEWRGLPEEPEEGERA